MKTVLFTKPVEELKTEALAIGVYEDDYSNIEKFDALSDGIITECVKDKEFTGKLYQISIFRLKNNIKRIILVGLGKKEDFNIHKARIASGKVAVFLRDKNIKDFSMIMYEDFNPYDSAYSIVEGVKLALYSYNDFKTHDDIKNIETFTIIGSGNNFLEIDNAIRNSIIISDAVYIARDLANKPSNVATPSYIAKRAQAICKKNDIKCKVLEKEDMIRLGMNGILAVNRGSDHPPKFVVMEYEGGKETICLVGKGITFDSGGISIKSSSKMEEMKFDMCGGAAVISIMYAASRLKLPYRLVGLVPLTENLPGGNAYKPGDILKMYNGKTVEVQNTDAEGRLILADALSYSKNFNPKAVIDYATLTGACVVALGSLCSGLFSNDDSLADKILEAGNKVNEKIWRLPMYDEYKDEIKSNVADFKNIGTPGNAGSIAAAMFLKEFVECKRWAHLDIAGTAWTTNKKDVLNPEGGTGVGIRMTLELLKNWKN